MNNYRKRITIAGVWILCLAFIGGIAFTWYTLRSVQLHPDAPGFLTISTILPLIFMFDPFYLKVTISVLGASGALIIAAVTKHKLWWLSIVGFHAIGIYWLFWVLRVTCSI